MEKYIKNILIAGAVIAGGVGGFVLNGDELEEPIITPIEVQLTVEVPPPPKVIDIEGLGEKKTREIPVNEYRIVPSSKIHFFSEGSFTLNDIISEIEFELRVNGESERYHSLVDLRDSIGQKLVEVEEIKSI